MNTAAVQLIEKAKNILHKYYNPQLHKAANQREMTEEERIVAGAGGDVGDLTVRTEIAGTSQTTSIGFIQLSKASQPSLPDAPETWTGDRKNKGGKSNSVLALMDMLKGDIEKDTQAAQHEEETAARDYNTLMESTAKEQATWGKAIVDANSAKAELEEQHNKSDTDRRVAEETLEELRTELADLHADCDFIIAHFEERAMARETEMEGLIQAKTILSSNADVGPAEA